MRSGIFRRAVSSCSFVASYLVMVSAGAADPDASKVTGGSGRGSAIYGVHCSACHGSGMDGGQFGPPLKGISFHKKWLEIHDDTLLLYISKAMPPANPGSLTAAEYRDIAESIIAANSAMVANADASPARHVGPIPAPDHVFHDEVFRTTTSKRNALLEGLSPVTDEQLSQPKVGDWLTWRGDHSTLSFSPLNDVNRKSVKRLSVSWAWSLPVGTNEIAPLVHDGVMFVQSANEVQALDASNGDLLWKYVRNVAPQFRGSLNSLHRSISIYGDNVYVATADRHVVALEAKTGKLIWDQALVDPKVEGVILSAGPVAVRGKIIQGTSLGMYCKGGCAIFALDAKTGESRWRVGTIAQPEEPGGDTWNNVPAAQRSGGAVWIPASYDPRTGLIYVGTSGTYNVGSIAPVSTGQQSGSSDGLYTNSTLAIDPETGRVEWFHQHFPTEMWDLDEAFERSLIDLAVDGVKRSLVVTIGKIGIMDALDAKTGDFVFARDLGLQNLVTKIDPKTGTRSIDPSLTPAAGRVQSVCPSPEGVRNWLTTAYNPRTNVLFVPMGETCMDYTWQPKSDFRSDSGIDIGWSVKPRPEFDGNYGRVEAIDLLSRKTLWVKRQRSPLSSSLLSTAGGVVFQGDRDRMFRAMDDRTGESLWSIRLNAVPNSSPISYSVDGKQFVAVVAGGGGLHDMESREITPEIVDATATTTLWVFSLHDER